MFMILNIKTKFKKNILTKDATGEMQLIIINFKC